MNRPSRTIAQRLHDRFFSLVHASRLIYNACWEDPRIDRELMAITPESRIVMITSAGCNCLDYLLDDPAEIACVDLNPRQNALLELKKALFRHGSHDDLFRMFGLGRHEGARELFRSIRPLLPEAARDYWDRHIGCFAGRGLRKSFYYYGAAGEAAFLASRVLLRRKGLRGRILALLDAPDLDAQRRIYREIEPEVWGRLASWLVRQPWLMAMLGVPRPQIRIIEREHEGGLAGFVKDRIRRVMTEVPASENYFWRVYLTGSYTPECCPNYLRRESFETIRERVGRVRTVTDSLSGFLRTDSGPWSHFVLLDHQDWLARHDPEALAEEWDLILRTGRPGARVLMRSAGIRVDFLPGAAVGRLRFQSELTERLHRSDRVGTYGSLLFAEVTP